MRNEIPLHSCYACDYLGPAEVVDDHANCQECDAVVVSGIWINYHCRDCGFEGVAYTPPTLFPIPCKDCGIEN